MTDAARTFASAIAAAGALIVAGSVISDPALPHGARFAALFAASGLAAMWNGKGPACHGAIAPAFVFTLIGVARFSFTETLVAGCFAALAQCASKRNEPVTLWQGLFNAAAAVIGIAGAAGLPRLLGLPLDQPAGLIVSAAAFWLLNTALAASMEALTEDRPALRVWRDCQLRAFPYYLAGAAAAGAFSATGAGTGWAFMPILLLVCLGSQYFRLPAESPLPHARTAPFPVSFAP